MSQMSSPSQRVIGPKVPCDTCGKELAASYVKTHMKRVCMTTPDDEVDKDTNNVEKEKVCMTKPEDKVDKDVEEEEEEEETMFLRLTNEHVKRTEEGMVEAAEEAELVAEAAKASQEARGQVEPDPEWLAGTMERDMMPRVEVEEEKEEEGGEGEEDLNPFAPPRVSPPFLAATLPAYLYLKKDDEEVKKINSMPHIWHLFCVLCWIKAIPVAYIESSI